MEALPHFMIIKHGNIALLYGHKSMKTLSYFMVTQKPEAMHHFMATKNPGNCPISWSQKHGKCVPFYGPKSMEAMHHFMITKHEDFALFYGHESMATLPHYFLCLCEHNMEQSFMLLCK